MAQWNPHAKYDHVFAIIRADRFFSREVEPQTAITVKKVVWTQEEAEEEVRRLNELSKDEGSIYFWQISRLERKAMGRKSA